MANYRNKKILQGANGAPCMNCGSVGTTVAAHSDSQRHGKGMGIKAHDCYVAYLCLKCHSVISGLIGKLSREEIKEIWQSAFEKTVLYWFLKGIVK